MAPPEETEATNGGAASPAAAAEEGNGATPTAMDVEEDAGPSSSNGGAAPTDEEAAADTPTPPAHPTTGGKTSSNSGNGTAATAVGHPSPPPPPQQQPPPPQQAHQTPAAPEGPAVLPGEITFRLVENDNTPENSERLVALKNIFAKQLPKMPKEYIVRLVFDRRHRAVALCRGPLVIGGICYRPYPEQRFAEIAFCAITATEQVKGYGTRLMNHLKEQAKREGLRYFLTYADNYAIGYFRKQGFSKTLGMPRSQWTGYIKDYDGAHLMECYVHPTINYLDVPAMLARQREFLHARIKEKAKSHVVYPGLTCFKDGGKGRVKDVMAVPGVREAGWNLSQLAPVSQRDMDREKAALQLFLTNTLREARNHRASWPFLEPVDLAEVPDYTDVVTDPIDLSLIENRLKEGDYYRNREMLLADLLRMCHNCKLYNNPTTDYYSAGQELETFIRGLFKKAAGAAAPEAVAVGAGAAGGGKKGEGE